MAWWRRDSSWIRMPVHRYACRTLRDREAALRTRCFSKSNPTLDSHENNDGKRPLGVSDLEWAQLQHYKRWRQRFEDDPYKALFGASEDMLNGKGLKQSKWFSNLNIFPEWMVREMGLEDGGEKGRYWKSGSKAKREDLPAQKMDQSDKESSKTDEYPKSVDVSKPKGYESLYPEPSSRFTKFERSPWSSGIDSPSDSRRLRDQDVSSPPRKQALESETRPFEQHDKDASSHGQSESTTASKESQSPVNNKDGNSARARKTSFIDEFLADTSEPSKNSPEWRQTALDRRASADTPIPRRRTDIPIIDVALKKSAIIEPLEKVSKEPEPSNPKEPRLSEHVEAWETNQKAYPNHFDHLGAESNTPSTVRQESEHGPVLNDTIVSNVDEESRNEQNDSSYTVDREQHKSQISSLEQATLVYEKNKRTATKNADTKCNNGDELVIEPEKKTTDDGESKTASSTSKSRIPSLEKLPKDDLDFLSADDIRASMGRVMKRQISHDRQKLEEHFNAITNQQHELHPMIEAQIKNDQIIRRTRREMLQDGQMESNPILPPTNNPSKDPTPTEASFKSPQSGVRPVSVLETGLEFMMRWLHTGGDILSRSFFQDPVDVLADQTRFQEGISSDPFFKGIVSGVQKCRLATRQIKFDLEQDIPTAKVLIERLNNNERNVMRAAGIINGTVLQTARDRAKTSTEERIRVLKRGFVATDEEFKKACEAVDVMIPSTTSAPPSEALSRRFRIAADVLRKNAQLTRVMIFGLQTRLEASKGQPSQLSRDLAHRLLALQDTQLALSRVVSRRMHVLGIKPTADEEETWKVPLQQDTAVAEDKRSSLTKKNEEADGLGADFSATNAIEDQVEDMRKRHRLALANAKLAAEVEETKKSIEGLYSREPKTVSTNEKVLDTPNPLAHSLFRPFGLQLESLKTDKEIEQMEKKAAFDDREKEKQRQKEKDRELVKEVQSAYEDAYGPITVDHRQVSSEGTMAVETLEKQVNGAIEASVANAEEKASADSKEPEEEQRKLTHQLLKNEEISPTISTPSSTLSPTATAEAQHPSTNTPFPSLTKEQPQHHQTPPLPDTPPNYEYRIYTHNSTTDTLLITPYPIPSSATSSSPETIIPAHAALSTLSHPSKFLPHLPQSYDTIAATPEMLIIRTLPREGELRIDEPVEIAFSPASACPPSAPAAVDAVSRGETEMVDVEVDNDAVETRARQGEREKEKENERKRINPIDGTTYFSPTGFVGTPFTLPSDSEFDERRKAAGRLGKGSAETYKRTMAKQTSGNAQVEVKGQEGEKEKRGGRVGVGGVVKTAIVAGAWCYVVGVVAELVR